MKGSGISYFLSIAGKGNKKYLTLPTLLAREREGWRGALPQPPLSSHHGPSAAQTLLNGAIL